MSRIECILKYIKRAKLFWGVLIISAILKNDAGITVSSAMIIAPIIMIIINPKWIIIPED